MAQEKMVQTTIQLPVELRDWLIETAQQRYDSMAGLIRQGVLLLRAQFEHDAQVRANDGFRYPTTEERLIIAE